MLHATLEAVVEALETRVKGWPWNLCGELFDEAGEDVDGLLPVLLVVVEVDVDDSVVCAGRFESEVVDDAGAGGEGRGSVSEDRRGRGEGGGFRHHTYLRKVLPAPAGERSQ